MNDMFLYYLILFSFVIISGLIGVGVASFVVKYMENRKKQQS
ncbi:hypothetical protein [Persephonella sp. KM09-Lau-8]|nr:hypothetical protein [Persephonella sp. KM09-Lau-8]